jgi:hypothetical protein
LPSPEVLVGNGVLRGLPLPAVSDQAQWGLASEPIKRSIKKVSAFGVLLHSVHLIRNSPGEILTRLSLRSHDKGPVTLRILLKVGKLSSLVFLGLKDVAVDDELVQQIAAACSKLERVEFSGLRVTGISVKELCMHTNIKELALVNCCDISADAIEWARARGVMVMVKHSEAKTGRRIRHG